jgi:hypothetical protein
MQYGILWYSFSQTMTTFTYESVTPANIGALLIDLKQTGSSVQQLTSSGSAGSWRVMGNGVIANAVYDGVSLLTVEILSKPFFILDSMINAGILKALGRAVTA